ncbi:MAG: hypothetical protein JOZ15_05375 [Acidobacteria bacterium]|nr:hypothetical protein [Acidobacteriota bacterium]
MSEMQPPVEVEVQHYAGILRQAVRAAGFAVSDVERQIGTGPKALRRVFCGAVDLKLKHIIAVLRIIGMSQAEFFAIASRTDRRGRRTSAGGEMLATFERIGYRGALAPVPDELEDPASEEEFDRLVEDAVDRVMKRRESEGKPILPEEPLPPLDLPEDQAEGEGLDGSEPE